MTVAVKVTDWPTAAGFWEEVRPTVVAAGPSAVPPPAMMASMFCRKAVSFTAPEVGAVKTKLMS